MVTTKERNRDPPTSIILTAINFTLDAIGVHASPSLASVYFFHVLSFVISPPLTHCLINTHCYGAQSQKAHLPLTISCALFRCCLIGLTLALTTTTFFSGFPLESSLSLAPTALTWPRCMWFPRPYHRSPPAATFSTRSPALSWATLAVFSANSMKASTSVRFTGECRPRCVQSLECP